MVYGRGGKHMVHSGKGTQVGTVGKAPNSCCGGASAATTVVIDDET